MVKQKTYPNGLRLIVKQLDGVFSVSTGILVGAGSRYETPENNGISHLIEHMMFKGTDKRTAFEISDAIDSIGGQINAFTTKETTCYYVKSTADHTEGAVEVLADIFFNSVLDKAELDKERGVVIEEINMTEDTPDDLCFDLLARAQFGGEGLGATILGPIENIKKLSREDLVEYISSFYRPENVVVCFAGKITFEEAEALTDKYIASSFKDGSLKKPPISHKIKGNSLSIEKDIEQAHVCLSYPACSYAHEDMDKYTLMNAILGGSMSSILFQKVREELGLAYSVYSFISSYADCGCLCVYAGVNPAKKQTALDCILEEIAKFKAEGVTEKQFLRAKEQMKSSFVYSQESNASQMLLYAKYLLYTGKEFDFEAKIKAINSITLEELNDFIRNKADLTNYALATVSKKQ